MNAEQILARTAWAEDRSGGRAGMEPIMGVVLNRAEDPGKDWWGDDVIGVCLQPGAFSCWHWKDPNFRPLLTVDIGDNVQFREALELAQRAVSGLPIDRANGATHYYARASEPPDWSFTDGKLRQEARAPCFFSPHHVFFKIGPGA